MSACVVCVVVLAVLYGSMWQELSWGLPLAEILWCAHGSAEVEYMSVISQELSGGLPFAVVLLCMCGEPKGLCLLLMVSLGQPASFVRFVVLVT